MNECCKKRKFIDDALLKFFDGNQEKVKLWLNTPNPALGDITPMQTPVSKLLKYVQEAMGDDKECMGCQ